MTSDIVDICQMSAMTVDGHINMGVLRSVNKMWQPVDIRQMSLAYFPLCILRFPL